MTGGAVHNTQEWKGSEEYRQALPGTSGLLAADTCDSTLTGSLGMHGRGCLGADPLGSSSRSMEKCRNSLSCILGTSDSVPDCCMSLTPIPGTGGVPGGTVGDGRPRSWSLGGQSSSGSSFTPRIRAAISPSVRTTHSSLFSLLSHFMGSEKQSVLFGKASLKEQSSRNSGYLGLLWEQFRREDTTEHREGCAKFILWTATHAPAKFRRGNHLARGGEQESRLRVRSVYPQGVQDMKAVRFDGYHCLIVGADI